MGKQEYRVERIDAKDCAPLLASYHYLTNVSKGFKSGFNVGLIKDNKVVGVCIFTGFPVPELVVGLFGLDRTEQSGMWELSRLVLSPCAQKSEHNLAG